MIIADPNTGLFIDNSTGKVYSDAAGSSESTDPRLNAQAQRNLSLSNQLFARMGSDHAAFQRVMTDQTELVHQLDKVIRGEGPSVAGTQAQIGLESGNKAIQSAASGASGANVPLAQYGAIRAMGDNAAQTNQAATLARAQEVADATRTKAGVLGQQGAEANQSQGIQGAAGSSLSGTAGQVGQTQAQIDEQEKQRWQNFAANLIGTGGSVLATGLA